MVVHFDGNGRRTFPATVSRREKGIVMSAYPSRPFAVSLTCLVFIVSLTSCGHLAPGSSTQRSTSPPRQTGTSTPIASSASPTSTILPTPTVSPTPTSPSGPVPFTITRLSFGVMPGDHVGMCGAHTFFTATVFIYAPAHNTGGAVTYTCLRSDTSAIPPTTVTFPAGTTSHSGTST